MTKLAKKRLAVNRLGNDKNTDFATPVAGKKWGKSTHETDRAFQVGQAGNSNSGEQSTICREGKEDQKSNPKEKGRGAFRSSNQGGIGSVRKKED